MLVEVIVLPLLFNHSCVSLLTLTRKDKGADRGNYVAVPVHPDVGRGNYVVAPVHPLATTVWLRVNKSGSPQIQGEPECDQIGLRWPRRSWGFRDP